MPAYAIAVDIFGLCLAVVGFMMTFCQRVVRRFIGRVSGRLSDLEESEGEEDALSYGLRIAGVMLLAFGVAITGMFTLFAID